MKKNNVFKITISAMFVAMIFVFTIAFHVTVLPGSEGYLHFGDAVIYLFASIIGGPLAIIGSGIGMVFADFTLGAVPYAPFTFIIKMLIALVVWLFSRKSNKIVTWKTILAIVIAGVITVGGYGVADYSIYGAAAAIQYFPSNIIQAVGSGIVYVVLGLALDKIKLKTKINNKFSVKGE